jgi:hypothetical protein
MSAGGRYVAIATVRTNFDQGVLELTAPTRTLPDARELYVVDLKELTLDRVTRSTSGGEIDADVQNGFTISADGERVAFTSFAGNLFFGDANQRLDAFVATREPDPGIDPPPPDDDGPGGTITTDEDPVKARAKSGRKGLIELTVTVPAAGSVKAEATAKAGKPRKQRTLATERAQATKSGRIEIALRPVRRYRAELRERGRIRGRARISFVAASGGENFGTSLGVTFRYQVSKK